MLLRILDGTLSIKGQTVLSHFQFEIRGKEKIAIVGKNGSGKTTLLRLLAGELSLDRNDKDSSGGIVASKKLSVGILGQNAFSDASLTVEEKLQKNCPWKDRWERERFDWEQEHDRIFTGFGLSKEDKKKRLCQFSQGEQTKIALIHLLLEQPELLLLDEPTNHLDIETVEWLEKYLRNYPYAVVVVSHDRFFLDQVADTVYEIQNRALTRYAGNYTDFRAQKQKNLLLQEKHYKHQQEEIKRLEKLIERFQHKPRKAAFARSRKKILERMEPIEKPGQDSFLRLTGEITPAAPAPKWILEAQRLQIGYGEKSLLELSLRVRRGQKIGVIGPNGAGKSTFLKTVAGLLPPLKGKCELGPRVQTGYFDQQTAALHSDKTVLEHFHDQFPALTQKEARNILGSFLFTGKAVSQKVSQLSGGEKSRLILAELLQSRPSLFLLDEPTNHMDISAKEALECAFRAYKGTILFVSHDRYFIRQIADSLLIFEEGCVYYYPFGYIHYMERRQRQAAGDDSAPRIRAEEQALLDSLKSAPRAERHRLREPSDEQARRDWQMRLAREALKEAREALERFLSSCDLLRRWEDPAYEEEQAIQEEALYRTYTERCLDWHEKWADGPPDAP